MSDRYNLGLMHPVQQFHNIPHGSIHRRQLLSTRSSAAGIIKCKDLVSCHAKCFNFCHIREMLRFYTRAEQDDLVRYKPVIIIDIIADHNPG